MVTIMLFIMGSLFMCIVAVFPIATSYFFYRKLKKHLWLAPIIIVTIMGLLFIKDVSVHRSTFVENVKAYFENGVSYGFVLIYLPASIISLILTVIFYIYDYIKRKKAYKTV